MKLDIDAHNDRDLNKYLRELDEREKKNEDAEEWVEDNLTDLYDLALETIKDNTTDEQFRAFTQRYHGFKEWSR